MMGPNFARTFGGHPMKLYHAANSGNAFKARLLLSLLGLEHEIVDVKLAAGDNRTDAFLALNPRGQIPVLVDGDRVIWDSQAILVYLARRHGGEDWLPLDADGMTEVMQWLAVAENELLFGLARARAVLLFDRAWNYEQCKTLGEAGLQVLEAHLADRDWLAVDRPTIADIACYPYVALAPEGNISLSPYAAVQAWIGRVQGLPGYVDMVGITRQ